MGDAPWAPVPGDPLRSVMVLALTKYPPSCCSCCRPGRRGLLLALFEGRSGRFTAGDRDGRRADGFYLLHLYVLRGLYLGAVAIWGTNQGQVFGCPVGGRCGWSYLLLIEPLYYRPVVRRPEAPPRDLRCCAILGGVCI